MIYLLWVSSNVLNWGFFGYRVSNGLCELGNFDGRIQLLERIVSENFENGGYGTVESSGRTIEGPDGAMAGTRLGVCSPNTPNSALRWGWCVVVYHATSFIE